MKIIKKNIFLFMVLIATLLLAYKNYNLNHDNLNYLNKNLFHKHDIVHSDNKANNNLKLENECMKIIFNEEHGSINEIILKSYYNDNYNYIPFIFNYKNNLSSLLLYIKDLNNKNYFPIFKIFNIINNKISFISHVENGYIISREYSLIEKNSYLIDHKINFYNLNNHKINIKKVYFNIGSMHVENNDNNDQLGIGYNNYIKTFFSKKAHFKTLNTKISILKTTIKSLNWISIKNNFFALILNIPNKKNINNNYYSIMSIKKYYSKLTSSIEININPIKPFSYDTLNFNLYLGPKYYFRLLQIGKSNIMNFGIFNVLSKLLLKIMKFIHKQVNSWGITIIILTLIIKIILYPFVIFQSLYSKKIEKIQHPLNIIQEKYQNNPYMIQKETIKLFTKNKINPLLNLLPIFIQIPFFLSFYFILKTSLYLRMSSFLWIKDLSRPDTIFYFNKIPINILPIIMAISIFYQIKQSSPINVNKQNPIINILPFVFTLFCYNLPSCLVLYWTIQNIITILQLKLLKKINK